jgi:hypothetical protein
MLSILLSAVIVVIGSILLAAVQQHERCPASPYSPTDTNSDTEVARWVFPKIGPRLQLLARSITEMTMNCEKMISIVRWRL